MNRLEEFMEKEGWTMRERCIHGKTYICWRKNGFQIDDEDIEDLWFDELKSKVSQTNQKEK